MYKSTTSLLSSERHALIQQGSSRTKKFRILDLMYWPKALTSKRVNISVSVPDGLWSSCQICPFISPPSYVVYTRLRSLDQIRGLENGVHTGASDFMPISYHTRKKETFHMYIKKWQLLRRFLNKHVKVLLGPLNKNAIKYCKKCNVIVNLTCLKRPIHGGYRRVN